MASTNKTTNYDLSQFIETDKPGWLTDYNGDMRKLDTALKAISDVADGASGGLSSLTDRMTAAEGAITTNANDIDALEARADVLEAQAQSTAGTIAGIQTEQITQNAGIEAATELGYNLARPYDSASTYAVGDYVLFQNTLYKCVTAIATGEAFDPTKWLAIKATDEIGGLEIRAIGTETVVPTSTCRGAIIRNFYTSTATDSTSYSPAIVTPLTVSGLYAKLGNMRILAYRWMLEHEAVTLNTKEIARFYTAVNYQGIDLPTSLINSPQFGDETATGEKREWGNIAPGGTNCALINTYYNTKTSSTSVTDLSGQVLFVYSVA